jgi:hypothetical protein
MSSGTHISTLYREFADALTDVLAENAVGLVSRGRLARTRAAVNKHPDYSEHGYFLAVEWHLNIGKPCKTSVRHKRLPTSHRSPHMSECLHCDIHELLESRLQNEANLVEIATKGNRGSCRSNFDGSA